MGKMVSHDEILAFLDVWKVGKWGVFCLVVN